MKNQKINLLLCFILLSNKYTFPYQEWDLLGNNDAMQGSAGNEYLGASVSFNSDGTKVAIGAYGWSGNQGKAAVYQYDGTTWSLLGSSIDGENAGDQAGYSVALNASGTIVAIGENYYGSDNGRVRVFQYTGGDWSIIGTGIAGDTINNEAGSSVAISDDGTVLAIGEPGYSGDTGRVNIYKYTAGSWTLQGSITGENANDLVGSSIAMNSEGTILSIGEPGYPSLNNNGRVRVYQYIGSSWTLQTSITGENAGDQAGYSVSLDTDGSILAIGEIGFNSFDGRTRIYKNTAGSWGQLGNSLVGENLNTFGHSVSLNTDGTIVAIGAQKDNNNSGKVYIYSYTNGSWQQIGNSITGEHTGDQAGYSVSLNSDGNRVAVGEPYWLHDAANGKVRIFFLTGSANNTSQADVVNNSLNLFANQDISNADRPGIRLMPGHVGQTQQTCLNANGCPNNNTTSEL